MNKFKIFSVALLASVSLSQAQDLNQAKKAIDAEQFESAKSMLKTIVNSKPSNGRAAFLLGNIYLTQNVEDSAKIYFQKGLTGSEGGKLNYIGLGQMDLDNGNSAAAQANFTLATKDVKKKDVEEFVYIGKAYMNSTKPDYKSAIAILNRAKINNPQDAQVLLELGNAFYGDKNQNEAYVSYRNAFQADATLIRAKMQLGVLLKGAKAYTEAVKAYDNVIATSPNYGPVYRELAETYYLWGRNEPAKGKEYLKKALDYYEKYMSLTDYSLASRMRHADFLILAGDYVALEAEANKMKKLDNVNPRILRYLGYSAYENGNVDVAIKSLESFISNPTNKIIAKDYMYLGFTRIKKAISADGKSIDAALFNKGMMDVKKSVEMEITMTNDLQDTGKKLFEQKFYNEAAAVFELATTNKESRNYLLDNFYLGNSIYFYNTRKDVVKVDAVALQKADVAFGNVIEASPTTQDAYIYRARTNRLLEKDDLTIKFYEAYIKVVTDKGAEELAKPATKTKLIEANNNIAVIYSKTDKTKAKEYLNKTLAIDPANQYALDALKSLK
ncbi:cytochrome c-type biogenesis protein CcmH/NrfG [Flavobacterium sp. CG_9.10]|uniref:tetratricopeptide repeat protein n=1 Tax=Flavobacterium sp. CG_9.10 TaxID=2787729 RepID=UPI0018CBC4DC|nr:tetratricopeptide repeat protein [Flavobacterium sp. CG_9.10]MBG6112077.1 cytochrome c-type biogenesis protein CcmH/NrfG [Flavobacterium sp. CG_9.10]